MEVEIDRVLAIKLIASIIFSFLPAKTLLQLTCVCKKWYALIHNPEFISMHNIARKDRDNLVIIHKHTTLHKSGIIHEFFRWNVSSGTKPFNELPFESPIILADSSRTFHFQGSCDGLVCCSAHYYKSRVLYIWNVSMKKFKMIKTDSYYERPLVCGIGRWGQNFADDDYKVVSFSYTKNYFLAVVNVYTLSTNSWKRIDVTFHTYIDRKHCSSVSSNGRLYWLGSKSRKENDVIVSFDLQNEVVGELLLPQGGQEADKRLRFLCLGEVKDSLALISTNSASTLSIWVMKEHDLGVERWSKLFTVDKPECVPIYFGRSGVLVNTRHDKLFLLDLELQEWIDLHEDNRCFSGTCRAIDYNESLVLINDE